MKIIVGCAVILNMIIAPLTYNSITNQNVDVAKRPRPIFTINRSFLVSLYSPPPWLYDLFKKSDPKQCKYSNCFWSTDKYLHRTSDAIIFHGPSLERTPILRSPGQIWVMLGLESPLHYGQNYKLPAWKSMFNWTMTYRRDSDIYFPYSEVVKKKNEQINYNYSQVLQTKSHDISWAVSNCKAPSDRDSYAQYLKEYIDDISIFGKCGKYYCGEWENSELCFQKMAKEHKFVLSFENSFCTDYITEKAFIPYTQNIIPIVRGGAQYSAFLPRGTYIDTGNFTTVKELADFVADIGRHKDEYTALLRRKNKYTILPKTLTYQKAVCQVCEKLNEREQGENIYPDITEWLWKNGGCFYPKDVMPN